jgi:transcriptional regulator with XRE-family HTH domain
VKRIRVTLRIVERKPLAEVIGANCKRIRTAAGVTQDELARHARMAGLRWTASKVRDFEVGRTAPTFATVLALSVALDSATAPDRTGENLMAITKGEPRVRLADLVAFDGFVSVNDEFNTSGQRVADYCAGHAWEPPDRVPTASREKWDELRSNPVVDGKTVDWMRTAELQLMRKASGLTEDRLAQRLGVSRDWLAAVSFRLWHKPFSQQRDLIAGTDANKQKRGQVTRTLQAELKKALADGDD